MKNSVLIRAFVIGFLFLFMREMAFAQSSDEMGSGVCVLVNALTGKWLFGFTILAVIGSGAALLFGGELSDGLKKMATIVSIVGLILGSASLMAMMFSKFSSGCS